MNYIDMLFVAIILLSFCLCFWIVWKYYKGNPKAQPQHTCSSTCLDNKTLYYKYKVLARMDCIQDLQIDISEIVREEIPGFMDNKHSIGRRDCPISPIGLCIFNVIDDPDKEHCIYCAESYN